MESYKLFGVDVTQIPGLLLMALRLFSEVGRDMSRWPTAAHFVSWLALCPDNDISGGKILWRGGREGRKKGPGPISHGALHSPPKLRPPVLSPPPHKTNPGPPQPPHRTPPP